MPTPDMSFISAPAKDNDVATVPDTTRWIPQTLKERNLKLEDVDSCSSLISELPLVSPSTYMWAGEMVYDERDSFAEASIAPYHPAYVCCVSPLSGSEIVTDTRHNFRSGDAYLGRPQGLPCASAQLDKLPIKISLYRETTLSHLFLDSFVRAFY